MLILNFYFYILLFYVLYFLFLFFNLTDPINLLLSLIMLLTNITAILLMCGAEFIAIIFLIIYVGAIAMLILFTIMMLNLKKQLNFNRNNNYYYLIIFSFLILFFNIYKLFEFFSFFDYNLNEGNFLDTLVFFNYLKQSLSYFNELKSLGIFFYSFYSYPLLEAGFILLLGMVGPIILANQKKW